MNPPIIGQCDFRGQRCDVVLSHYESDPSVPALTLVSGGQPQAHATVNLAPQDHDLPDGCVWIKSWGENFGMSHALQDAGIIGGAVGSVSTGFVRATIHHLLKR